MAEVELTAIFLRNGESNIRSGRPKEADYPLLPRGERRARKMGKHLRTILGCEPDTIPHVAKYVYDGTNRARATLAIATSIAGLPGELRNEPLFHHGQDEHADVRVRVEQYLSEERDKMQDFLDGWDIDLGTQKALSGLYLVIATSHQTIGALVGPELGIPDESIDSEQPLKEGGLSRPVPYIPFGSITEVTVGTAGLNVVHAGITPETAAVWAIGKGQEPPRARRLQFGVPAPFDAPKGKRYAGSVPRRDVL